MSVKERLDTDTEISAQKTHFAATKAKKNQESEKEKTKKEKTALEEEVETP